MLKFCSIALILASFATAAETPKVDDYTSLYSGQLSDHWHFFSFDGKPETAAKIFSAGNEGEVHVYRDFPDGYQIDGKTNDTHGIMVTKKSYGRYSFKFDYKWGKKKLNNFDQFQYDAGCFSTCKISVCGQKLWNFKSVLITSKNKIIREIFGTAG
ncbi:MAG: hypothetical protein HC845_06550 [Akkermansiaceae bacterium]|nr:hypothetical protein [Akkermansiaceae bacterium]